MRKAHAGVVLLGAVGLAVWCAGLRSRSGDPTGTEDGADPARGSLLVQVTFEPDGAPGAGVCARVLPLHGRDESLSERLLATDARGLVRVERIAAGRVRVTL